MEYLIILLNGYSIDDDEARMNNLAEAGWRVVSTYVFDDQVHLILGKPTA